MPILGPTTTPPAGNSTITQPTVPIPGTRVTAMDLIKRAMRLNNALASGEVPSAAEASDFIIVLNQMIDSYNAESLMPYTANIQDFAFVGGQQVYKFGIGGDFNAARPADIERVSIMLNNGMPNQLEVPITLYTDQDWQKVSIKSTDSTFPLAVYDDASFPFRNLSFWPIPRDASSSPRIYSWQQLSQFPNLQTVVTFPPAYYEAIQYNLAIRLAPELGASVRPEVVALAATALANIKSMNSSQEAMTCDLGVAPGPSSRKVRNELFSIP